MSKYNNLATLAVKQIELSYAYEESSLKLATNLAYEVSEYLDAPKDTIKLVELNENLNGVVDTERLKVKPKLDGKYYIGLSIYLKISGSKYFGSQVLEVGIQYGSPISMIYVLGKSFSIDETIKNPFLSLCESVYSAIEDDYSLEVGAPKNSIGFIR